MVKIHQSYATSMVILICWPVKLVFPYGFTYHPSCKARLENLPVVSCHYPRLEHLPHTQWTRLTVIRMKSSKKTKLAEKPTSKQITKNMSLSPYDKKNGGSISKKLTGCVAMVCKTRFTSSQPQKIPAVRRARSALTITTDHLPGLPAIRPQRFLRHGPRHRFWPGAQKF